MLFIHVVLVVCYSFPSVRVDFKNCESYFKIVSRTLVSLLLLDTFLLNQFLLSNVLVQAKKLEVTLIDVFLLSVVHFRQFE